MVTADEQLFAVGDGEEEPAGDRSDELDFRESLLVAQYTRGGAQNFWIWAATPIRRSGACATRDAKVTQDPLPARD